MGLFPCYNMTHFDLENMTSYKEIFHCSFLHINLTTCVPEESKQIQDTIASLCQATERMWTVCFWLSTATGLLGNSLAILTILSLPMTTATFYVCLLAISDLLAILVRASLQLMVEHEVIELNSEVFNLACLFFDYFASYSNWLLVLICFERFLTIRFPLRKRTCFTMARAQMVALLMSFALLVCYGVATWRLGYTESRIFILRNLLYALLPLCLILVTIALIWCHLWRVHQDREVTFNSSQRSSRPGSVSSFSCSQNNNLINGMHGSDSAANLTQVLVNCQTQSSVSRKSKNTLQEIARLENSLTMMMLVAAIVFVLLTMPHCVAFFIYQNSIDTWNSPLYYAQFILLNKIFLVMSFFNLSINFILYFLSAKKFRTQLFKVFRRGAWVKTLFNGRNRPTQAPTSNPSTQQESVPLDPIANGEYVSLRLLSGSSTNGTIRLKSSGKIQFALDQSYYD